MPRNLAAALLGLVFAWPAAAQCHVPEFGILLGYGDDGPLYALRAIGFPFPFAGTTWSHVHVSNNGMVYLTHGSGSNASPTGYSDSPAALVANLRGTAGQPPRIAPFWKDLVNAAANDGGVFLANPNSDCCVITWRNAVEWGRSTRKTIQCLLFRSGEIAFWYSDGLRVEGGAMLSGISPGGGAADPGPVDLAPGSATAAGSVAYETFLASPAPLDFAARTVTFTPDGSGGYAIGSLVCAPASHTNYGAGCGGVPRESFYAPFTPASAIALAGSGLSMRRTANGYIVETLRAAFVPPTAGAATLPLGDDGEVLVALAQPFPHASGIATSLRIAANGFVSVPATTSPQLGAMPDPARLLDASTTAWYLWHDFAPSLAGSGAVRTAWSGARFVITWDGVWDFGGTSSAAGSTFQFQFDISNGDVHLVCVALSPNGATGFLAGYSPGGASLDPGPLDLLALPLTLQPDIQPLRLQVGPNPVLGRTLVFVTENIPAASPLALQIVSLQTIDPGLSLAGHGAPGCLQSVGLTAAIFMPLLRPLTDTWSVAVPNQSALVGVVVGSQSAALDFGSNALGVVTSNAVRSVFNTY